MTTVASVDYVNRRIYLSAATVGVPLDMLDVYRDVRALRRATEAHQQFRPMIVAGGNIGKTATTFTAPYVQLLYGCRIVPFDVAHSLLVIRDTFSDDGQAGVGCFDRSTVSAEVDIDFSVDKVEVRTVNISGGGGTQPTEQEIAAAVWAHASAQQIAVRLAEVWGRLGLDPAKPLFNGQTQITFGDIVLALTESGGNVTVTRQ